MEPYMLESKKPLRASLPFFAGYFVGGLSFLLIWAAVSVLQ